MKLPLSFLFSALFPLILFSQPISTPVEKSKFTRTPPYAEVISWWKMLDSRSQKVRMLTMGPTDAGFPLNLVLVSGDAGFDPAAWHRQHKTVLLILNGIHPGEPDGIDACMLLARDIATGQKNLPANVVLAIVPLYNIGGSLNRSTNYRVDQNGPEAFGFRGNSQNLDLNRDFIKSDSREARSFADIYHFIDPDIFIDNHVSNGADYQHVMTLISSQHSKLGGVMGEFLNRQFEPALYSMMKEKGYDLVPYVNFFGETPDNGWPEFFDSPRYSSGYATLWSSFGFTTETHMLKPYEQRVKATVALMECFINFAASKGEAIRDAREKTREAMKTASEFPLRWSLDTSRFSGISFKGFEAGKKTSGVSGLPRLYYDRNKPFEKKVKLYNYYKPSVSVNKPSAYIIPQGWWKVIELLQVNKVQMRRFSKDTTAEVDVYHIDDYKTSSRPYEMHHANSDVVLSSTRQQMRFRKGDVYIPMNQSANRFLMEVLEPQSNDSYFSWNYFDGILVQKEGYSNYVFEDRAAEYLQSHPRLRADLEKKKASDTDFARSARAQLDFIFRNTPYMEPDYLRYPVYRVK